MENNNRYIILFLLIFTLSFTSKAQKLTHVMGEVIVEVRDENGLANLISDVSKENKYRSNILSKQIMSQPMNLWLIRIDPNIDNEIEFLEAIKKNRNALLAQQNHITGLRDTIPNDPRFTDQWQYINIGQNGGTIGADLDIELAWTHTTGGLTVDGDTIVVCVVDDGINATHPDLGDNLWVNHQEIAGNGIDDDENGYIDDIRGWNAYGDDDNVYVGGGHGTPVAGIVGAQGNNEIGVAGVNWDVKLMIVRGGSPESTALASYAYPYMMRKIYNETNGEKGAFVVSTNSSWGVDFGDPEDAPIWCDFYNSLGEVGILNFGATINGNTNVDVEGDLPTACSSDFLISVTNMNRNDTKVNGAGYGYRTIDLGAFGAQTFTLTSGSYGSFGGTSGATPHVAGTAALLYSVNCPDFIALVKSDPAKAALAIKDCILHGVDPNESLFNITTTGGRLNVNNAVTNLLSTCGDCTAAFGSRVSDITDKNGTLAWYDNGNLGSVDLRYKLLTDTIWIELEDLATGFQFTNLIACTPYEYQIKTTCPTDTTATEYTYSRVFQTEGCCELPSGISVNLFEGNAIINWNEVLAVSNFIVEWKISTSMDWILAELGPNNSFLIQGIEECELYQVRIKSQCAATNNESEFSEIFEIKGECGACTRDFCSFPEKNITDEWIDRVQIEDIFDNPSGVSSTGYNHFLDQFSISLTPGFEYNLILHPGFSGNTFDEFFSAFIDFNQNGQFEVDEVIYEDLSPTQIAVMGLFAVPIDAIAGTTRMRVVMRFNQKNGPCDENGFEYGEIEDYCVNIEMGTDCPTEYRAGIVDSTLTSLTLEIKEDERAEMYIIDYRKIDSVDFLSVSSPQNIITINELEECTQYEYKSSIICEGMRLPDTDLVAAKTKCQTSTQGSIEEDLFVTIYPNPSFANLSITFNQNISEEGILLIMSLDGKRVFEPTYLSKSTLGRTIDTQALPKGVYFVKITIGNQIQIKKWVKL